MCTIMDAVVISIGGSVLLKDGSPVAILKDIAEVIHEVVGSVKPYIVVGGGRTSREYISWARELGADESTLDEVGISLTRINAMLLICALKDGVYPKVAMDFDEAILAGKTFDIVVMGGTHPGHTTDAVATMLGEKVGAERFVNATIVDGVFTSDPKVDPDATLIPRMSHKEILEMTMKSAASAGPHIVIDPMAARIINRSGITTSVVNGTEMIELRNSILGKPFNGTVITS